ncbi:MAG TPA: hypothetical protein VHY35_06450 [Stellaceae bacterium]|jgi:hypothetical protein|nr:hypothetical protein [Stellaceae bacterium]
MTPEQHRDKIIAAFREKFTESAAGGFLKKEKDWSTYGNMLMADALEDFLTRALQETWEAGAMDHDAKWHPLNDKNEMINLHGYKEGFLAGIQRAKELVSHTKPAGIFSRTWMEGFTTCSTAILIVLEIEAEQTGISTNETVKL